MYHFFALYNNRKSFQTSTIRLNRKCSKVVGISSDIFGIIGTSSENHRKSSQEARMFSEIPVMTRQKSHAFDSEKVGRYTVGAGGVTTISRTLWVMVWHTGLYLFIYFWREEGSSFSLDFLEDKPVTVYSSPLPSPPR